MTDDPGYVEHPGEPIRYFDRTFDCDAVKVLPGVFRLHAKPAGHRAGLLRHPPAFGTATGPGRHEPFHAAEQMKGLGHAEHLRPIWSVCHGGAAESTHTQGGQTALEAKVFGGWKVLASLTRHRWRRRMEFVKNRYSSTERIPVSWLGSLRYLSRKVYFSGQPRTES